MEPVSGTLTRYVIKTRVSHLEQRFAEEYHSGVGDKTVFKSVPLGWFVGFDGSHELLHLGSEFPNLHIGDAIRITIEKEVADAG